MRQGADALPVACSLTRDEMATRKAGLLSGLIARATTVSAIADGYVMTFAASGETLQAITSTIDAERQCCRFLSFEVRVAPDGGPVTLTLSGPEGTRAFLDALLTT